MSSPLDLEVYVAARWDTKAQAAELRDALAKHGIGCTSRWISEGPSVSSIGDGFTDAQRAVVALGNVQDVKRARALVLWNPGDLHKVGTGGCHWETGLAYGWGMPQFIVSPITDSKDSRSNIFHFLPGVQCFSWPHHLEVLAIAIRAACPTIAVDAVRATTIRATVSRFSIESGLGCQHERVRIPLEPGDVRSCADCGAALGGMAP